MRATCPMHRTPTDLITLKVTGEYCKPGLTELCIVFEIATTFKILCSKYAASQHSVPRHFRSPPPPPMAQQPRSWPGPPH